jgi:hypothetical protein
MIDKTLSSPTSKRDKSAALPLLTDEQMIDFIINGYIMVKPQAAPELHAKVCSEFDRNGVINVDLQNDPVGMELLDKSPTLREVLDDPIVLGAIQSLMGPEYFIFGRFCHASAPGAGGVFWHQDDVNVRHYQLRRLMILYYPQTVTADMGPTYVVPGTHLVNTPTDRMANYGNIRGQVPLTVEAGTVVITHYDIWHTASHNRSDKMRYLVKYYVDRVHEPTGPTWQHNAATAIPLAMQRMHVECTAWSPSDFYKERHLRWLLWSYLLGIKGPAVWDKWTELHPTDRPVSSIGLHEIQGYLGAPLA